MTTASLPAPSPGGLINLKRLKKWRDKPRQGFDLAQQLMTEMNAEPSACGIDAESWNLLDEAQKFGFLAAFYQSSAQSQGQSEELWVNYLEDKLRQYTNEFMGKRTLQASGEQAPKNVSPDALEEINFLLDDVEALAQRNHDRLENLQTSNHQPALNPPFPTWVWIAAVCSLGFCMGIGLAGFIL